MSDNLEDNAEFWLPAEFLTDDDILMLNKDNNFNSASTRCSLPSVFPYDYDGLHDHHQLAHLTRRLSLQHQRSHEKPKSLWGLAGSPQSTLVQFGGLSSRSPGSSNGGSPNGTSQVSSPPTSPLAAVNDPWDLIYQAAGQVAKLKMNGADYPLPKDRTLISQQRHSQPPLKNPSALYNSYVQQVREEQMLKQQQRCGVWSNNSQVKNGWFCEQPRQNRIARLSAGSFEENEQVAWPSLQYVRQQNQPSNSGMRGSFPNSGSGSGCARGVKRPCAGTGVFLPRRYGSINNSIPAEPRKRPDCSNAPGHGRVAPGLDRNLNVMLGGRLQPRLNGGSVSDYDILVARRNALLIQRSLNSRAGALSHEISLPQEWTY